MPISRNTNEFIEQELDRRIRDIEAKYKAHAVAFNGPIVFGVDDLIRTAVERRYNQSPLRPKLVFVLTTPGGYIDVV